jgi:hypothetical protein
VKEMKTTKAEEEKGKQLKQRIHESEKCKRGKNKENH